MGASRKKYKKSRHRSRRAFLSRVGLLFLVLGCLCLLIGIVVLLVSYFAVGPAQDRQVMLGLGYLVGGGVLLILRLLLRLLGQRIERRNRRPHRSRESSPQVDASSVPSRSDSGAVLVLTLLLLAVLSALLFQVHLTSRAAIQSAESHFAMQKLRTAARDAAFEAMHRLADDEDLVADHTNEPWATPYEVEDPSGIVTLVRITDQQQFFDVNNVMVETGESLSRSPETILMDILTLCGEYSTVHALEALTDWLDTDENGFRESAFYAERDPPYRTSNRSLLSWREWLWVDGFPGKLFERREKLSALSGYRANLIDCVTLLPFERKRPVQVNVNTASFAVLVGILGLNEELRAQQLVARRSLQPMTSLEALAAFFNQEEVERFRPYLSVKSDYYQISTRAYADQRAAEVRALVRRDLDGETELIQWLY